MTNWAGALQADQPYRGGEHMITILSGASIDNHPGKQRECLMITRTYQPRHMCWIAVFAALLVCRLPLLGQTSEPDAGGDVAVPTAAEYTGPAILSRGNLPTIGQGLGLTTIQPFFYINQIYDTGMSVTSNAEGLPLQGVAGVETGFGIRGTHRWKRITLNLNYEGNYRQYTQQTGLGGTNQYFRAIALIPLRRHLDLTIRQGVSSLIQDATSLSVQPFELYGVFPTNEPFDTRAKVFDSQVAVTYQKTQRLSFSGAIEGSLIQQDSPLLIGSNTLSLTGDMAYLWSPHATIGLDYTFAHYGYTVFGSADLNSAAGNISWRLSRTVDAAIQVGVSHRDILGLAIVPLDPEVTALLGVTTGIQVSRYVSDVPTFHFRLSKRWHYASADVGYQRGTSAGNGLLLTSDTTTLDTGFHYIPSRNWNLSVHAGRTTMQALTATEGLTIGGLGNYNGYIADVSLSRSIRPSLQVVARFDARPFSYVYAGLQARTFYTSTIGFRFSPGEIPVAIR
jgi:hypothetical protein